ncbi:efflux RND transporter periplasmic adaptor subunit [Verrucomicrobiaceae bacterium 227]
MTRKIVNILVAPLILILAIVVARKMIASKKSPPVKSREIAAVQIVVFESSPGSRQPQIDSYGNTRAFLTTTLSSQVSGQILSIDPNFQAGNSVKKGAPLVEIDSADYQSILSQRQADLAISRQTLEEEKTLSRLAREDWLGSGRKIESASPYTLRVPQLAAAQASVDSAGSAIEQAELNLKRTTLRAPFDAIVESRSASPGNIVNNGTELGSLIARDRLEVRLPITPDQASHLTLPTFNSGANPISAKLTTPTLPGTVWDATISRVEPSVDPKNQTIYLIGEVPNPFDQKDAFLPVGAFVNATITGDPIAEIHALPEVAVIEDAYIWIVNQDNKLVPQPIEISFSQDDLILARIETPVAPMPLRVARRPLASFKEGQLVKPVSE